MATGIVSVALLRGQAAVSMALLVLAAAGYLVLLALSGWRMCRWPGRVAADLAGDKGFAFLTLTAASDVLASRARMAQWDAAALVLFGVGAASWLVLGYGTPLAMAGRRRAGGLDRVNGTWFLWVVGVQSVAVAAGNLPSPALAAVAEVCWAIGLLLYPLVAGLVLARLLLHRGEITHSYWIFMGAAAITVLAGTELPDRPLPHAAVTATCVVLWSFCTWLIPLLVVLTARQRPRYQTGLWSMVFPIGMHAVATTHLGRMTHTSWLTDLGHVESWLALAVWSVVFIAMLHHGVRAPRAAA